MTTKQSNRMTRYLAEDEAQRWGVAAAIFNEPTNPYPRGSELAVIWQAAFNNQLAVLADAAQAVATGQITAAQERMDMAEPQPSWWQRVRSFAAWVLRKPAIGDG